MGEFLCGLMGLALLGTGAYALIAMIVRSAKDGSKALQRAEALELDVTLLKHEQQRLKQHLNALERRLGGAPAPVTAAPEWAPVRPSTASAPHVSTPPRVSTPPPIIAPVAPEPLAALPEPPPAPSQLQEPAPLPAPESEAPPPSSPPPDVAAPPESSPPPGIEWERWLGVRGAAVLGGGVLALAGLMFFRYAIEAGIISPEIRVTLAVGAGLGCILWSERLRAKYPPTANGVAAAAIVVLYAAFWALHARYALAPLMVSFVLMALTTVACCLLSIRYQSQLIAILGIAGGFATPLLLSSGANRPFALFGYVFLLDLGFLYVARRRGWRAVSWLLLAATVGMELLWMVLKMEPRQLPIALVVLGLFALVFVAGAERTRDGFASQAVAILAPFMFVQYFAGAPQFGAHLYPIATLLVLLNLGAGYVARSQPTRVLPNAASAATLGVLLRFLLAHTLTAGLGWELAACALLLAAAPHAFAELEHRRGELDLARALPALIASAGAFVMVWLAVVDTLAVPFAASVVGLTGLACSLLRFGALLQTPWLYPASAGALSFALVLVQAGRARHDTVLTFIAVDAAIAIGFQALALFHRKPDAKLWLPAERAAALVPIMWLLGVLTAPAQLPNVWVFHAITFGWAYLTVLSATRRANGIWLALACGALAFVHNFYSASEPIALVASRALALEAAAALFFMLWPFLNFARFRAERFAWYTAALAGPLWFLSLRTLWTAAFGAEAIGLLPVLLALASLAALYRARKVFDLDDPRGKSNLAWLAAVALSFISVAIPLQLDRQWITIGWALEGVAVIALWTRLDHPGLKYFALALHSAVFIRLVVNGSVVGYEPRSTLRIFNWLMYTYYVPVASMVGAAILLARHEVARARPGETISAKSAGCAGFEGFYAIVVFFVWINLAIADWFSNGRTVTLSFERLPARDLATSISWAAYAVLLLALGVWRNLSALRWMSLCFLLLAIGKVFLYDLHHLTDLYRVMSLVGLAFSLLLVSLAYQRFVFRKKPAKGVG